MKSEARHPASFRDRSGFIFQIDKSIYRQVGKSYQREFNHFLESGLYRQLIDEKLLIPHKELERGRFASVDAYKILKPERVNFISYPYEWSFSQLKDAALLTLRIQNTALNHGMSLKDASAFNIQFHKGRPVLIDTLSFEIYKEGEPWVAYRQFCQHFLAPLALMTFSDYRLQKLTTSYIDGIPIDLASRLLPFRTRLNPGLLTHIHLHAVSQRRFTTRTVDRSRVRGSVSLTAMRGLIDSLRRTVLALNWEPAGTEWSDYYSSTHNYDEGALEAKRTIVASVIDEIEPKNVWDLGANTGMFTDIATDREIFTVSFDIDPGAVEINYRESKQKSDKWRLPLILDLTNPTPAIGWKNKERDALLERGPADLIMALALVHHLAISNNVPIGELASFFHNLCNYLLIEFVPKSDTQVQKLLAFREDIFDDYTQGTFENEFSSYFDILRKEAISGSDRMLYLLKNRSQV